ncbi:hypothetical protein W97_00389 [Coniosporium apollinis CBS 100218]|uniref:FAS1 domain-containing protein n=1 Tax=Coniosporium apollinis (strain CBS 100218) TaxID=1168221 RepID=R7YGZ9_CONA1|nr:uncharacterized protein W97_00389 [Coniosporium apollinis CBS 100218]EON61177.1 hypothetical protein W97_00389 [Coniosporium apollinis CBS 100218]
MQYTALTLLVLAAAAVAAPQHNVEKRQEGIPASIVPVLLTGMPPDIISLYLTNAPSASAVVESQLMNGGLTSGWFASLPTDVQSYLLGPAATATESPVSVPASVSSDLASITSAPILATGPSGAIINSANGTNVNATVSSRINSILGANSSAADAVTSQQSSLRDTTRTTSAGRSASSASEAATASSSAGAAVPSAVIGAGLAGALGFIGMLAL